MLPKPSPDSPPMFENAFIDAFSRTHWSAVPIIYVPIVLWMVWTSVTQQGVSPLATLGLLAAGVLAWTFVEYVLHRWLFHWDAPGEWGKTFHWWAHGVHHDWPRDRYRLVMPPAVSLSLYLLFFTLFQLVMGAAAWGFGAGFVVGYIAYDMLHYYMHHASPKSEYMKALRKHHLTHHSPRKGHDCKYGVSTQLWDHVFRTVD